MNILTFVNNELTVIRGDEKFVGVTDKPSFISGEFFYYEPTNMMTENRGLTPEEMEAALEYVESFVFPESTDIVAPIKYYVDEKGSYVGNVFEESYIEVPNKPKLGMIYPYWDGEEFIEGIVINKATNTIIGAGDLRTYDVDAFYVPKSKLLTGISYDVQDWDPANEKFIVNPDTIRFTVEANLYQACKIELSTFYKQYTLAPFEEITFPMQLMEAKAYMLDNTIATPFINNILRGNETTITPAAVMSRAQSVVSKENAMIEMALIIGRYQKLFKQIQTTDDIEVLNSIVW